MLASRHAAPLARVSSSSSAEVWFRSVFRDLCILFLFLGSPTVAPQFSKHFPSCLSQVTILAPRSCYGAIHSHLSSWTAASCPVPHQLPTPVALWSARHFHPPGFVAHSSTFHVDTTLSQRIVQLVLSFEMCWLDLDIRPFFFFLVHPIATRCLSIWWSSYPSFWEWEGLRF